MTKAAKGYVGKEAGKDLGDGKTALRAVSPSQRCISPAGALSVLSRLLQFA